MTVSRRKAIALGAGAALAIPAALQARWLARDFTRPGAGEALPQAPAGHRIWSNWSGLHHATPREIFAPESEEALALRLAEWDGRVRPVGSGHSFIDLVPTNDLMVDISRFAGIRAVDHAAQKVTFGAGTRLRQAAMLAEAEGLAFPNLPDIDVQTLAGSFATATHGTGRGLTALHDRISGFRLVTPSGEIRDVTRASDPALFAAGRVSLGALGVMSEVTLDLVTRFALRRRVMLLPTDEVIATMAERARQHHYFEFYVLPHTGHSAVITHDLHEGEIAGRAPSRDEDFISTFKMLRDVLGWFPWARRKAFAAYVATQIGGDGLVEDETDLSWKLLSTSRITRMNEMEYHLPEAAAPETLRAVIAAMESRADTFFPMEVRFTGPDDAWLSPFADGVRCSIAVHTLATEPYAPLFDLAEPVLRAHGGRPHWGKLHSLGADDLAELYPNFAAFQALRKALDPDGKFLNPRLARLMGESVPA